MRAAPLAHPRRQRLLAIIEAEPAHGLRSLSRATGWSLSVVRHHLAILYRSNLVHAVEHSGELQHYRGAEPPVEPLVRAEVVQHGLTPIATNIMAIVAERGRLHQSAILADPRVAEHEASATYHLHRLVACGFLSESPQGRRTYYEVVA